MHASLKARSGYLRHGPPRRSWRDAAVWAEFNREYHDLDREPDGIWDQRQECVEPLLTQPNFSGTGMD